MASRAFYLVSTAVFTSTALILWFGPGRPAQDSDASPQPEAPGDQVLGVREADHDPANRPVYDEASPRVAPDLRAAGARRPSPQRGPRPPDLPAPPAPPVAGSPAMNAESEASAAVQPRVAAMLGAELERRRDALRKICWPPGSDAGATFTVEASYAGDGSLVTLGVSDVPGLSDVSTCLMGQIGQRPPVLAEAPGVAVSVAVPLAFAGSQLPAPPGRPVPTGSLADR